MEPLRSNCPAASNSASRWPRARKQARRRSGRRADRQPRLGGDSRCARTLSRCPESRANAAARHPRRERRLCGRPGDHTPRRAGCRRNRTAGSARRRSAARAGTSGMTVLLFKLAFAGIRSRCSRARSRSRSRAPRPRRSCSPWRCVRPGSTPGNGPRRGKWGTRARTVTSEADDGRWPDSLVPQGGRACCAMAIIRAPRNAPIAMGSPA